MFIDRHYTRLGTKYFAYIFSDLTPQMHCVGEILCVIEEESEKIAEFAITQLRSQHGG